MKDKRITMVQWTNLNRNNNFVNLWQLSLLCDISGAIHLALVGLTAGWLADKIHVSFKNFKFATDRNVQGFALFNKGIHTVHFIIKLTFCDHGTIKTHDSESRGQEEAAYATTE